MQLYLDCVRHERYGPAHEPQMKKIQRDLDAGVVMASAESSPHLDDESRSYELSQAYRRARKELEELVGSMSNDSSNGDAINSTKKK